MFNRIKNINISRKAWIDEETNKNIFSFFASFLYSFNFFILFKTIDPFKAVIYIMDFFIIGVNVSNSLREKVREKIAYHKLFTTVHKPLIQNAII
jgi:hypothetical protein